MKHLTIMGIFALLMLLALPGVVSAADVSVSGSIVDEDLTVTAISPNVGAGAAFFANEPNVISVTVTNNGGLDAAASTVSVNVGGTVYTAAVGALVAGTSETVTVTDTASHTYASGPVTVTATADSSGVIAESDEANNAMTSDLTVYNNGYKGKRYTTELGGDLTTQASFDGRYDVIYSAGNSEYKSSPWAEQTFSWTAADLPIPAGATVDSARLYQGYTYNKMGVDPAFAMSFNGNTVTPTATYMDIKGFGSYSYPYGLYVYDVTSQFNTAGNSMTITPETGVNYGIYGAYLIVTYSDPATTEKQILINDEFDNIQSQALYSVTTDEATAYATFSGVDTTDLNNAQAIAILASAGDTDKSKFFFNGQEYTGFWADYLSNPQIGFSVYDVTSALTSGANEAGLQSYDPGTKGDGMYAMNTILVIEKNEGSVGVTSLGASTTSGDAPLEVTFTATTSGYITGYAWTFEGTENTDYVFLDSTSATSASPKLQYLTRGTYDVSLTVSGIGSGNTATLTETDYITVMVPAPQVDFSADTTTSVIGQTVILTATNTGGQVDTWAWTIEGTENTDYEYVDSTSSASQNPKVKFLTANTYDVSLTAIGTDYDDTEIKTNYITVGEASIEVTVIDAAIDFGTMQAGVDETGSTTVNVDVTYGTAWSVTASAANGGYMMAGTTPLASPFQLSNDGTNFQAMTSNFANFMTGFAGADGSGTANVKQSIAPADAPGSYSITLTFTGSMA
jgi:PKD repeat protein